MRFRHLESHFDRVEYQRLVQGAALQARRDHPHSDGEEATVAAVGAALDGLASTPRQVEAHDGEATPGHIVAMLQMGLLGPDDLVDEGKGWVTLREHPLFAECCDALARERRAKAWRLVGLIAGALLLVAGVLLLARR